MNQPKPPRRRKMPGAIKHWFRPEKLTVMGLIQTRTLAGMERDFVKSQLKQMCPIPTGIDVLEVGPAYKALAPSLPFKSFTYIEADEGASSRLLMGVAKRQSWPGKVELIYGDIRKTKLQKHFGLSIMCEVFTHIPPRERLAVLDKLAEHSQSLFIVDRHDTVYPQGMPGPIYRGTLVNYQPMAEALEKKGFLVTLVKKEVDWSPDKYFVLMATRKPRQG